MRVNTVAKVVKNRYAKISRLAARDRTAEKTDAACIDGALFGLDVVGAAAAPATPRETDEPVTRVAREVAELVTLALELELVGVAV